MAIDQFEMFVIAPNSETLSSDAIVFRYGEDLTDRSRTTVVVVDSGRFSTGGKVQDLVELVFETDTIDLIVSTHADQDHSGGIRYLLTNMTVGEVWIHRPQDHRPPEAQPVVASLHDVRDILTVAKHKGVPVREPLTDTGDHGFPGLCVLGPSEEYFRSLMDRGMYDEEELELLDELNSPIQASLENRSPNLRPSPTTSLRNNSSAILLLKLESMQLLLTGDAGVEAFESARPAFQTCAYEPDAAIIQLPHHGSRNNLNPETAQLLLGSHSKEKRAFVSAAVKDRYGFPHEEITDEFIRAGRRIPRPNGSNLRYSHNCPIERPDSYGPIADDRYIVPSWEAND